jgi:hypothetical protein
MAKVPSIQGLYKSCYTRKHNLLLLAAVSYHHSPVPEAEDYNSCQVPGPPVVKAQSNNSPTSMGRTISLWLLKPEAKGPSLCGVSILLHSLEMN